MKKFTQLLENKNLNEESDSFEKEFKQIQQYIKNRMSQWARLNNFDYKQKNAKEELKKLVKPNLKQWTAEAMKSLKII